MPYPVNDDFAFPTDLGSADSGSANIDNTGATLDPGELTWGPPNYFGADSSFGSVWYKWTAPADGLLTVRTGLTPLPSWDTFLQVMTGDGTPGSLVSLAVDDDGDIQAGSTESYGCSIISDLAVTRDTVYWVRVTWYDDVSGPVIRSDGVLTWSFRPNLPDPPTMVTVRGRYLNQDDLTPASGSLTFTLENLVRVPAGAPPYLIVPFAQREDLDGTGAFSVSLPAVDPDDVYNPQGTRYGVEEVIDGRRRSYALTLTPSDTDVDLADPTEP